MYPYYCSEYTRLTVYSTSSTKRPRRLSRRFTVREYSCRRPAWKMSGLTGNSHIRNHDQHHDHHCHAVPETPVVKIHRSLLPEERPICPLMAECRLDKALEK